MNRNHLTLTRQSLYDLVWSMPMSVLARDFGITDVGLAKRCRAVDVPIPYRGYWARVAAGQKPRQIPLPKYRTRAPAAPVTDPPAAAVSRGREAVRDGIEPTVRFGLPSEQPPSESPPDPRTLTLLQRLETLKLTPAATIADTSDAVRRTAKYHKHTDGSGVRLAAGARDGLLIEVHVSDASLDRALLLADRFIKTAEAVGWTLTDPEPPQPRSTYGYRSHEPEESTKLSPLFARLLVEGEPIEFLIEERWREEPRAPTAAELAREKRERCRSRGPLDFTSKSHARICLIS